MRRLCGAALVASIGLALACGGGSGSGDGELTQLDETNAENVARSVMLTLDLTADLSTIGGEVAGGGVVSASSAGAASAARIAALGAVTIAAAAPIGPVMVTCDNPGGSVTLTGTVSTPGTLTVGDRFTADFSACIQKDELGQEFPELDGQLDFTVVAFSGDLADLFSLTLDLDFCGPDSPSACPAFTLTDDTSTFTVEGRVRTVSNNTAPPILQSSASGSTLALTREAIPAPVPPQVDSIALRSFQTTLSRDSADHTYQLTGNGRLASTGFDGDPTTDDGEVRYEITNTLAGASNAPPSEGLVDVTGSKSTLRIVPVTGFNIDFGKTYPAPSKTYAAAGAQPGQWSSIGAVGDTTLVGLIGGSSRVTLTLAASNASAASPTVPTNDDQRLLYDEFSSSDGASWSVTLSHVADGDYHVFLYAPSDISSGPMNVGGVSVPSLPGDPGGTLNPGISFTSVDVTVSGGTLTITGSSSSGTSTGLAGLQIVPVEDDDVNLEIDVNGDGEPESTCTTTWTDLLNPDSPGCVFSP